MKQKIITEDQEWSKVLNCFDNDKKICLLDFGTHNNKHCHDV